MRLTPLEIQNVNFPRKAIGGCDESAVRDFLGKVAREIEELNRENREFKEEIHQLRERLSEGSNLENALKDAIINAQKTTGMIKKNAEKESLLLLKESEIKAEKMLDDARAELKVLTDDIRNFKNMKRKLKGEMRTLLQGYMDFLSDDEK